MRLLLQLLQGLLIIWSASCLALLAAIAVVYARAVVVPFWRAATLAIPRLRLIVGGYGRGGQDIQNGGGAR